MCLWNCLGPVAGWAVIEKGQMGQVYNVGGDNEWTNIKITRELLTILGKDESMLEFVTDRPGHDLRYAIDAGKIERTLKWSPVETFESGIKKTIEWYMNNRMWCERVMQKYRGERLGVLA